MLSVTGSLEGRVEGAVAVAVWDPNGENDVEVVAA